jgi:hypothetical protein
VAWHSSSWLYRAAITVDNSAGSAGAGKYVNVTIPATWSFFWSTVLSTGYDLRVTAADGVTAVTFERATWTYASQVGTLEIGTVTAPAAKPFTLWLYWGNSGASDLSTAVVPASPLTGYIETLAPSGLFRIAVRQEGYGNTAPSQRIQKGSTDEVDVWVDFSPILEIRTDPHQGLLLGQEIESVTTAVANAGAGYSAGFDETKNRIVGRAVKIRLKAGASGTDYTATVTVTTTGNSDSPAQVVAQRFLVNVRDTIDS